MRTYRLAACAIAAVVACHQDKRAQPPPPAQGGFAGGPPPVHAACADGPPACSQDRASIIQCQRGSWIILQPCMGPAGCALTGGALACDTSISPIGAPCGGEGSYACSPDRGALLVCRGGRAVISSTCRGPRSCAVGTAVSCDHSTAIAGDPCDDQGALACAGDRATTLRCQNGVFVPAEQCRNGCFAAGTRVLCQ